MIEIINLEEFKKGQIPNTYGYISLGGFKFPEEFKKTVYIQSDYYKATCKVGEKIIDLIIAQFCNSAIVLGDLTNIPGDFLIDQEELHVALRNKIEESIQRISIIDQWSIGWEDYQRTTTSTAAPTIVNNFTYYDTKS